MKTVKKTRSSRAKPHKGTAAHPREAKTVADARRRLRTHTGFYDSLTPAQKAVLDNWDGPENLGPSRSK